MRAFILLLLIAFAAPAAAQGQRIERVTSPAGIEAWLIRDASLPLIALEFSWRGGSSLDPDGKEGRAAMTADLLVQGAGARDQQQFSATLEDRSISLGFSAGADTVQGSLRVLSRDRDLGVELLADALSRPRFDPAQVERIRSSILAGLSRDEGSPETQGRRAFARAAFGAHPYARPARGTPESVRALTQADLRDELASVYARDNLFVAAVGDIAPDELGRMLDRAFANLPAKARIATIPLATIGGAGRTIVLQRPGTQTFTLFGHAGIARDDPDLFAASVVNYILGGGGFNSRLMLSVRERAGLTYGIGTGLAIYERANLVQGSTSSENGTVGRALELVRAEWARMGSEGPTEEELQGAKDYLLGSFPLQFDGVSRIARLLVNARLDGRGTDWFEERQRRIAAVTLADARRVAARLFVPEKLLVVAVGQPAGVASSE
ncbi:MAG: insulinase family protein [Rhodospirillales bacterium]|nr:insulinase family protein [Rhodospirillales bacterium]